MKRREALAGIAAAALCGLDSTYASAAIAPAADRAGELPDWVPAPGMRRDISRNLLADVDPCPKRNCSYSGTLGQAAVLAAWCGAAFAPDYGRLGAWITTGGGHGDYFGNEVYAFELDTRRWVRLNDPYPGGPDSEVDYDECEYAPGIPLSSHTYQHTQYLPPSLGGGPKGSLLLVVSYACGKLARGTGRAHACDLASGRWSRFSVNKAQSSIYRTSATCFDTRRRRIWRVPGGSADIESLDLAQREFSATASGRLGGQNFAVDHTCAYDPERDLILALDWRPRSDASLWVLDLARPQRWWYVPTQGPVPPTQAEGMALEWCPPLRCFVGYEGSGATFVRKLTAPSGDVLAGPWRWSIETLDGDPPARRAKGPRMSFSRFRWAPSVASFVWADGRDLPVQAWRLRGT